MGEMKARVKCGRVNLSQYGEHTIAFLDRLSDHPKLGHPRCESQTRTSLILQINRQEKWLETLNTIYWWEDNSLAP